MRTILNNDEFKTLLLAWPNRAIQYLYDLHHRGLLKASQQRTHNREAAEDIVQDAIADLWEKHHELARKDDVSIDPYLYTIVRNRSITFYHRMVRLRESVFDETQFVPPEDEAGIDDHMIHKLLELLATFPAREQQCVVMKYFQEMTYDEIARELGTKKKAVERSLTSARKRLRRSKGKLLG